jgi:cyclophilin family peptidyl-prolyl cis-trans isomerase
MILTQPEGTEEWNMQLGSVNPTEHDDRAYDDRAYDDPQARQYDQQELPPERQQDAYDQYDQCANQYDQYGDQYGGDQATAQYLKQFDQGVYEAAPPTVEMAPYQPVDPQPGPSGDSAIAHTVRLETTVGVIDIIVRPDWAPHGTRRFLELAAAGDLRELAFYRAIKGCIVQFGLPAKRHWPPIPDDPPTGVPFLLGAVSFAAIGENTRRSTLFICIGDMSHMLGQKSWETPIGAVAESSLDVLEQIETQYGDIAEFGGVGPDTSRINGEGNNYLQANFPALTYIRSAWPLDWQQDEPPPPATHTLPSSGMMQPATVPGIMDQAAVAMQAAQEAQLLAEQAQQAAQKAACAEHVNQAAQAAQLAQQAAEAARAAALTAQNAQAAHSQQQQTRIISEAMPMVPRSSPMYPSDTLSASLRLPVPNGGSGQLAPINWNQPGPVISARMGANRIYPALQPAAVAQGARSVSPLRYRSATELNGCGGCGGARVAPAYLPTAPAVTVAPPLYGGGGKSVAYPTANTSPGGLMHAPQQPQQGAQVLRWRPQGNHLQSPGGSLNLSVGNHPGPHHMRGNVDVVMPGNSSPLHMHR